MKPRIALSLAILIGTSVVTSEGLASAHSNSGTKSFFSGGPQGGNCGARGEHKTTPHPNPWVTKAEGWTYNNTCYAVRAGVQIANPSGAWTDAATFSSTSSQIFVLGSYDFNSRHTLCPGVFNCSGWIYWH
jgi:hypothetical protein